MDENDEEVPRGTVGEICVRGDNVMPGYWNSPELTREALRNGWLHTGDGGYINEEGFVFLRCPPLHRHRTTCQRVWRPAR